MLEEEKPNNFLMAFKSEGAPTVSAEQANEFFNDDVSVSLFSELAKTDDKPKVEEEVSPIPDIQVSARVSGPVRLDPGCARDRGAGRGPCRRRAAT